MATAKIYVMKSDNGVHWRLRCTEEGRLYVEVTTMELTEVPIIKTENYRWELKVTDDGRLYPSKLG